MTANRLTIKNQSTNTVVYNTQQTTTAYTHTVASGLVNGSYYSATLVTYDANGNVSSTSNAIQFYCYSSPTWGFNNIPVSGIVNTASFNFGLNYSQAQGELLNSYQLFLYDVQKAQLSASKVKYVANSNILSHLFEGLEDNTSYFVRATGQTIEGTILDTGYVGFNVKYSSPNVFSNVELYNNCKDGYVTITSNLTNIVGASSPINPTYITGGGVDVHTDGAYVQWGVGYNIKSDFTASLWGYQLNNNSTIVTFEDNNGGKIEVSVHVDKDDNTKSYAMLEDSDGLIVFSELIDTPSDSDKIQIWVRRIGGVYDLRCKILPNPYLTFSSASSFTVNTYNNTKYWDGILQYSTNTTNWTEWNGQPISSALQGENHILYFRGSKNTYITGNRGSDRRWVLTNSNNNGVYCNGNIENLLDYEDVINDIHPTMANYCYYSLFAFCVWLITPPQLLATNLTTYCYGQMFWQCGRLTTMPDLPAMNLAEMCYYRMFCDCNSLTTAKPLPATTLQESCYQIMFESCDNLVTAPIILAETMAPYSCLAMFKNCSSLEAPPILPSTNLTVGCYMYMFQNCTTLKALPVLNATIIPKQAYYFMFNGCANIKISTLQTFEYAYKWRLPQDETKTMVSTGEDWNIRMLYSTGGTFKNNPAKNTTYYTNNPPV